jgi:hypothetical protein
VGRQLAEIKEAARCGRWRGARVVAVEAEGCVMNLSQFDLRTAYHTAAELRREWSRRPGRPIPRWLEDHLNRMDDAFRMSSTGQESGIDSPELKSDELIGSRETASILGWTQRQVVRLQSDLDGKVIGGRLVFIRSTVLEYAEGLKQ